MSDKQGFFDPDGAIPEGSNVFGLPFTEETAKVVLVPVPWDATTSYGGGASAGPAAIKEASRQQDLFDKDYGFFWKNAGIFMQPENEEIRRLNDLARPLAKKIIDNAGDSTGLEADLAQVNAMSKTVNELVYAATKRVLDSGKIPAIVGGDHSTPFGAIKAAAEKHGPIGILHFDAHHDLRKAYEGFEYSHASILYNVMEEIPNISKLVQVGIRDFGKQEYDYAKDNANRILVAYDSDMKDAIACEANWRWVTTGAVWTLPEKVWITFDIDGLDPSMCPGTGTPVPGGLSFHQAEYMIKEVAKSGRTIVGFDLNEVSPREGDEWDANVGMRMLFRMYLWTLLSNKLLTL